MLFSLVPQDGSVLCAEVLNDVLIPRHSDFERLILTAKLLECNRHVPIVDLHLHDQPPRILLLEVKIVSDVVLVKAVDPQLSVVVHLLDIIDSQLLSEALATFDRLARLEALLQLEVVRSSDALAEWRSLDGMQACVDTHFCDGVLLAVRVDPRCSLVVLSRLSGVTLEALLRI